MKAERVRGNETQADCAERELRLNGMMRASELLARGVTASTLRRLSTSGRVTRLGRGLYQLADAPHEEQHMVAEAAKRVPKAIVCLISALAFHKLTDLHPRQVWLAIGQKDWAPKLDAPPVRVIRLTDTMLVTDVQYAIVEGVEVKLFSPTRTVVDLFRYERLVGLNVAIEGLKEILRTRRSTPAAIADRATALGAWTKMRPYLEALTAYA
ncbi:MAG: type IV toxin-antitoxin system AbiEi family antitoxin domain-containing protein [Rhizobiaceae bacterium]